MTQNIIDFDKLNMIDRPKMLLYVALNKLWSRCQNCFFVRRQAAEEKLPLRHTNAALISLRLKIYFFNHQKSFIWLCDISCIRDFVLQWQYFTDDNQIRVKSNISPSTALKFLFLQPNHYQNDITFPLLPLLLWYMYEFMS